MGPNGEEWKRFCFADIMGVSRAIKGGTHRRLDFRGEQPTR